MGAVISSALAGVGLIEIEDGARSVALSEPTRIALGQRGAAVLEFSKSGADLAVHFADGPSVFIEDFFVVGPEGTFSSLLDHDESVLVSGLQVPEPVQTQGTGATEVFPQFSEGDVAPSDALGADGDGRFSVSEGGSDFMTLLTGTGLASGAGLLSEGGGLAVGDASQPSRIASALTEDDISAELLPVDGADLRFLVDHGEAGAPEVSAEGAVGVRASTKAGDLPGDVEDETLMNTDTAENVEIAVMTSSGDDLLCGLMFDPVMENAL